MINFLHISYQLSEPGCTECTGELHPTKSETPTQVQPLEYESGVWINVLFRHNSHTLSHDLPNMKWPQNCSPYMSYQDALLLHMGW